MKKIVLLLCMSALVSAFGTAFSDLSAQTLKWDFPVKPGTPEWEALVARDEMLKVCQIPEGVLNSLTTKELVEVCLNYPLFGDMLFYNSLRQGLTGNVIRSFNGVRELLLRKDNAQCLLDHLKGNDLEKLSVGVLSAFEHDRSLMKQTFAEMLLSHESVLANAGAAQQKEIARVAMGNMRIKESRPGLYGWIFMESTAYLLCASLTAVNGGASLSPDLETFLKTGSYRDSGTIIEELKRSFVKF